jgi:hypothetical protein
VGSETATTSGIGKPLCPFGLTGSNPAVPGKVSVTIDASVSPATYAKTMEEMAGATTVPPSGDAAFYLAGTASLRFLKRRNAGMIQADFGCHMGCRRTQIRCGRTPSSLRRR